jgi:hypothetical protein
MHVLEDVPCGDDLFVTPAETVAEEDGNWPLKPDGTSDQGYKED